MPARIWDRTQGVDRVWALARVLLGAGVKQLRNRGALQLWLGLLTLLGALALFGTSSIGVLRLVLSIDDDSLRRNTLNLLGCVVAGTWLAAQGVLRFPLAWLIDLRDLLPLPTRFVELYLLRSVLSLFGWWLLPLGPGMLYLVFSRSSGALGRAIAVLGVLAMVAILGRVVSMIVLKTSDLLHRHLGSVLVLVAFLLLFSLPFLPVSGLSAALAEDSVAGFSETIRGSLLLSAIGYSPPGLLVGIFESPQDAAANLGRLGGLLGVLAATILVDYRVLLRRCLDRPVAARRVGPRSLPLQSLFRSPGRISASVCLVLVEVESVLRLKMLRVLVLLSVAFAIVQIAQTNLDGYFLAVLMTTSLPILLLSHVKANILGWSHRSLAESFLLPVPRCEPVLAKARALDAISLLIALLAVTLTLVRFGWQGFWAFSLWWLSPILLVMTSDIVCGWADLRWPRSIDFDRPFPSGGSQVGSSLMIPTWLAVVGGTAGLYLVGENLARGPEIAMGGALLLVAVVALLRARFLRWQRSSLDSSGERILAELAVRG